MRATAKLRSKMKKSSARSGKSKILACLKSLSPLDSNSSSTMKTVKSKKISNSLMRLIELLGKVSD